jgi:hypothetical protein
VDNPPPSSSSPFAGGHYVPTAAQAVLKRATGPKLNFQGFFVGNAWTQANLDNTGCVESWHGHGEPRRMECQRHAGRTSVLKPCRGAR